MCNCMPKSMTNGNGSGLESVAKRELYLFLKEETTGGGFPRRTPSGSLTGFLDSFALFLIWDSVRA